MASRQEEKEARRREREAQEAAEARAAGRRRRVQLVFGGLLGLALLGGIVALAIGVVGGSDDDKAGAGKTPDPKSAVKLPDPVETDLEKAADAAGCDLIHAKYEGAGHANKKFTPADFKTNPPTSGQHFPEWYDDGIYKPGETPELGKTVHTLEHGRIDIQYKKGSPDKVVDQLESFVAEKTGYHLLLFENGTDMPYAVAATAWTQLLGCKEMNDKVFDALRTFYDRYVDKGPEQVP
jgi:hypothetical protein